MIFTSHPFAEMAAENKCLQLVASVNPVESKSADVEKTMIAQTVGLNVERVNGTGKIK